MRKQFSEQELLGKPLNEAQRQEILALSEMPDESIDTSDIAEIRELPANATRGKLYRGAAVRLRDDLRRRYAELAERKGVAVEDLVNETLAKAVEIADTVK